MTNQTINMTDPLYHYMLDVSLRESQVLRELRTFTARMSEGKMQIAPEQGQFLAWLVKLIGARKTLDVGVFTGYSSTVVALALPEDGQLIGFDSNKEWTKVAKQTWRKAGVAHKISLRIGLAACHLQVLIDQGEANTFDFAFIDADKQNYDHYYELCLQLLRPGGVMALDNMLQGGRVLNSQNETEAVQIVDILNKKMLNDERVELSLLPLADGVTLIRKRCN
ncbi:MAG: class I SAM-dependent methyltransferase [Pseudomonadota bacterium]|nr:class I SAM-dependent methyltransferase [Pseudomonadota bacterium]